MDLAASAALSLLAAAAAATWAFTKRPPARPAVPVPAPGPQEPTAAPVAPVEEAPTELVSVPRIGPAPAQQQDADQEATCMIKDQSALQALILETEARRRERFGGPPQVIDQALEQPE